MEQKETLEQQAEELITSFREAYLKEVSRLAKSGAVAEEDLGGAFLKCVLLITAERNCDLSRFPQYKEMLENLRCF